ncbi:MAG: hypothetical protein Q8M15_05365 [Bacteroidota bacterium]|nr:hypothetical protein [Bacteroidota bacterium]
METTKQVSVTLPTDDNGYLGRSCPRCNEYFKIKLGTGIKTKKCICPYCNFSDETKAFTTNEQYEYAKSIAVGQVKRELLGEIYKKFKDLEFGKKGDFLHLRVTTPPIPNFPIKLFSEKTLETYVTCDNCTLDFSVYGVFGHCPDCGQINAFTVFKKSLEIGINLLDSIEKQQDLTNEAKELSLKSVLNHTVSSFDSLGKELRKKNPDKFPERPRNLFQNIDELRSVIFKEFSLELSDNDSDFEFIRLMFQVRHIYEHNMGVVDDDFITKVTSLKHLRGKKYRLDINDLRKLVASLTTMTLKIQTILSRLK